MSGSKMYCWMQGQQGWQLGAVPSVEYQCVPPNSGDVQLRTQHGGSALQSSGLAAYRGREDPHQHIPQLFLDCHRSLPKSPLALSHGFARISQPACFHAREAVSLLQARSVAAHRRGPNPTQHLPQIFLDCLRSLPKSPLALGHGSARTSQPACLHA